MGFLPRGGCKIAIGIVLLSARTFLSNSHVDNEKTLGNRGMWAASLPRGIGPSAKGGMLCANPV